MWQRFQQNRTQIFSMATSVVGIAAIAIACQQSGLLQYLETFAYDQAFRLECARSRLNGFLQVAPNIAP